MTKKITITLCAIIIGLSTIFINNNIVKAEETTINESIKFIQNCDVVYYNGSQFTGYVDYELKTNYIDFYGLEKYSEYTGTWDALKLITKDVETTKYKLNLEKLYLTNYIEGLRVTIVEGTKSYYYIIKDNKFISLDKEPVYNFDKFTSISFYNNGSNMVRDMKHFTIYDENGYYINIGYQKGLEEGYDKGIKEGLSTNASNNSVTNYLKDWKASVGYNNLTNKGNFNLTSNNKSIYVNGYYELIKNDTITNDKPYYIYLRADINSERFSFGYKDLIFKGLPENTEFSISINNNEKEDTYLPTLSEDGKLRGDGWENIRYDTETYITKIIIIARTVKNGTTTIYNLKDYPSFEITSNEGTAITSAYESGYNNAKNFYYNNWYIGRYQQGYNDGTSNAGNYTFLSLIGSVVDAPIKAISNMLNFDLLGFNMSQFFFALLTVCIIVTIVKLLL